MAVSEQIGLQNDAMLGEARHIIDVARRQGVTLRLLGGLAVREHCHESPFCERSYRDIDLVTLAGSAKAATAVIGGLGWSENRQVAMATMARRRQFFRTCRHPTAAGRAHVDDRIDLYLDAFRLHHSIDLRRRLEGEPYTVSVSDVLLVKLQRTEVNDDDLHDIVAVIGDAAGLGDDDAPDVLNVRYIARLCARDWGLYHDVERNIARVRRLVDTPAAADGGPVVDLRRAQPGAPARPGREHLTARLDALEGALSDEPKGLRWRLRASLGERVAWHEPVDDAEGVYFAPGEHP